MFETDSRKSVRDLEPGDVFYRDVLGPTRTALVSSTDTVEVTEPVQVNRDTVTVTVRDVFSGKTLTATLSADTRIDVS